MSLTSRMPLRSARDLLGQLLDVLGARAPGEADHHGRVERLARLQTINGILALRVAPVFEVVSRAGRQRGSKGRPQQASRNQDHLPRSQIVLHQLVALTDGPIILASAGEPLGDVPQALGSEGPEGVHPMAPAGHVGAVVLEQRLDHRELQIGGEQTEGHPVAHSRQQAFATLVGLGHHVGHLGTAAQTP